MILSDGKNYQSIHHHLFEGDELENGGSVLRGGEVKPNGSTRSFRRSRRIAERNEVVPLLQDQTTAHAAHFPPHERAFGRSGPSES